MVAIQMQRAALIACTVAVVVATGVLMRGGSEGVAAFGTAETVGACAVGQHGTYRLRESSSVELAGGILVRQETSADLELSVLAVEDGIAEVGLRLTSIEFATDDKRDPARETAMATPFVVRFERGEVIGTEFPEGLADGTARQLDALIRTFQYTLPVADGPTFATETDGLGRYRAEYRRSAPRTVTRRKSTYLLAVSDSGVPCTVKVIDSTATMTLAEGGPWLSSAETHEQLDINSVGSLAARVDQHATLELQSCGLHLEPLTTQRWLVGAGAAVAVSQQIESREEQVATRPASAEDRAQFRAAMEKFVADGGTDMAAVHALARQLSEMPELSSEVELVLRRPELAAKIAAGLCHSLELAGGEACQSGLRQLGADGTLDAHLRFAAIAALGGLKQPSAETQEALSRIVDDRDPAVATTALLALGNIGSALRTQDAVRYQYVRDTVTSRVNRATDTDSAVVALRAAANTRDPSLAPIALGRLTDVAAPVRAAAAEAAGALGGPGVAPDLDRALRAEVDARVRASMVRGLVLTGDAETACRSCADLVDYESEQTPRAAMARVLADHVATRPELRPILSRLLARETSMSIASYVAGRLYRSAK